MPRPFARSHIFSRLAANDFVLRQVARSAAGYAGRLKLISSDGPQGFFDAGKRSRYIGRHFDADTS
jgi:hypothetical protein